MADSSAKTRQMRRKVIQALLAPYMNTYIQNGHVYVQFCNKWQTLVQKNVKLGERSTMPNWPDMDTCVQ